MPIIACSNCGKENPDINIITPTMVINIKLDTDTNKYVETSRNLQDEQTEFFCECGKQIWLDDGEKEDLLLENITIL